MRNASQTFKTTQDQEEHTSLTELRYELAMERLAQIPSEEEVPEAARPFFAGAAEWLLLLDSPEPVEVRKLYEEILPGAYEAGWASPDYAVRMLGKEFGPLMCALFYELRGCIPFAIRGRKERVLIRMELLLELYTAFAAAYRDGEVFPKRQDVCSIIGLYLSDYAQDEEFGRLMDLYHPEVSSAELVLQGINTEKPSAIEFFGKYVREEDRKTAAGLCAKGAEEIREMAYAAVENWEKQMQAAGFDPFESETVRITSPISHVRVVRAVSEILSERGLQPLLPAGEQTLFRPWQDQRPGDTGLWGAAANDQYLSDHAEDLALFLDPLLLNRKLEGIREAQNDARAVIRACAPLPIIVAPEMEKERIERLMTMPKRSLSAPSMSAKQKRLEAQWRAELSLCSLEFKV